MLPNDPGPASATNFKKLVVKGSQLIQGVNKVAGRLSGMASGVMNQIQVTSF